MNKKQAIKALLDGHKIYHKSWEQIDYIEYSEKNGSFYIQFENGKFRSFDMNDSINEEGYELYREPQKSRRFEFEGWMGIGSLVCTVGEDPNATAIDKAIRRPCTPLFSTPKHKNYNLNSHWKVTMEEILPEETERGG